MVELSKKVLKGIIATLGIAVATLIVIKVLGMFDERILVAVLGGAFGFQPLYDLCSKIKGLE